MIGGLGIMLCIEHNIQFTYYYISLFIIMNFYIIKLKYLFGMHTTVSSVCGAKKPNIYCNAVDNIFVHSDVKYIV